MKSHVAVALPLPVSGNFTYRIEGEVPAPGTRVLVPFRRSEQVGWIVGEGDPAGLKNIRPVLDVLEERPSIPAELLALARWMSEYYIAPLGITLRAMVPSVLSDGSREILRLTPRGHAADPSDPVLRGSGRLESRARSVFAAVRDRSDPVRVSPLRKHLGLGSIWPEIRFLAETGLVEHETLRPPPPPVRTRKVVRLRRWIADLAEREEVFGRATRQKECYELLEGAGGAVELARLQGVEGFSRSVVTGLETKELVDVCDEEILRDPFHEPPPEAPPERVLSPAQKVAVETLIASLEGPAPFLLHGVTGSGKTLVYIQILQEVVERRGGSAIVLVPEISLTPQTVTRFRAWFGDRVAVLHSALSDGERYDQWRQIRAGEKPVVVGARSALFAPVRDLGAIVVDEEHDGSYKQSEAPRYHARDVAVVRARLAGAICVLGSATPSLESWRNAEAGKFDRLSLPVRIAGRPLPPVEVVDLRRNRSDPAAQVSGAPDPAGAGSPGDPRGSILSPRLVSAVRERLDRREQAILLLNRRGYASFIQCRACGSVTECPNCSVSLTYHRRRARLLCHHCRHEEPAPDRCPECGSGDLSYRGLGTEQVERVVAESFPGARIARMDVDTTGGKWSHHEILGRVERGEVDLLLGTQMIAKGLDFPRVTLVGVVNADVGLHLPDFRASERSFQLLSQVAGRTGRGSLGGEVIIQSSLPEHYAIQAALDHDYVGFARRELEMRRIPRYPPHVRMVNVIVSSPDPRLAADGTDGAVKWVRRMLKKAKESGPGGSGRAGGASEGELLDLPELVGPAPCPIERLHGRWRWHFFLRGGGVAVLTRLLHRFVEVYRPPSGDVRVSIDRDPVALL